MMTRREKIVALLSKHSLPLQEVATALRADIRDVMADLYHVKQLIKPKKLKMIHHSCRACGYIFKERSRAKTPTKCPRCRDERIEPARYCIE